MTGAVGSAVGVITVARVDRHRNGVTGEGFWIVHFACPEHGAMMAVVFPPDPILGGEPDWEVYEREELHNPRVAVFQTRLLPDTSDMGNAWRGDVFAPQLYTAIRDHEQGDADDA